MLVTALRPAAMTSSTVTTDHPRRPLLAVGGLSGAAGHWLAGAR